MNRLLTNMLVLQAPTAASAGTTPVVAAAAPGSRGTESGTSSAVLGATDASTLPAAFSAAAAASASAALSERAAAGSTSAGTGDQVAAAASTAIGDLIGGSTPGVGQAVQAAGLPAAAAPCRDPDANPGAGSAAAGGAGWGLGAAAAAAAADEDEECTDLFAVSADEERAAGSGGCDLAVLVRQCSRGFRF